MNVDDVLQEQIEMSEKPKRLYYSKDLLSIEKSDLTKAEYLKYAKIFQQTQKRIQKRNTIIKAFINVDNIPWDLDAEEKSPESLESSEPLVQSSAEQLKLRRRNMSVLESEESAAQNSNEAGQGLKMQTPNEMFSGLLITFAKLQKLKNEIRQLLYSLYRSKEITKIVYSSLIRYI